MAGENRTTADRLALYRELAEKPYEYGFFQALRRIECANPDKEKIGCSVKPGDDAVRFGQEPSLAFAASTLSSFKISNEGFSPKLSVLFFGLFGPNGPLPLHLTEYVRERIRNHDDESFAGFADVFHHRLLSLFYRAWADAQPTTHLDRLDSDTFSNRIGSLIGIGTAGLKNRDALPDFAKLHHSGRFANQTRNAEGLLALLKSYFHIPARLEQYVGAWLTIPEHDRMRLGEARFSGSLGYTSTLGERVWECQSKFRLTFGPLTLNDFQRMLPGGLSLIRLIAIVRNYVGDEFDWDVHLILNGKEIKPTRLGEFGQLGWTSWMTEKSPNRDFDDVYINPMQEIL
jgi:type VI secretion system protein ImpH